MADVREAILARLLEICSGIEGISYGQRNDLNLSDQSLPAAILLDADEEVDQNTLDKNVRGLAPMPVQMNPSINIVLQDKVANVGTLLNEFRAKLIKAVLNDSKLLGFTGVGGSLSVGNIRYLGCAPAVAEGRMLQGQMIFRFRFTYVLNPGAL